MAKLVSLAVLLTVLLAFSFVSVVAEEDDADFEAAAAEPDPNLQTFYIDKHLQAVAGKPTEFIRLGYALNLGTEAATFKTTIDKNGKVKSVVIGQQFEERPTFTGEWDGIIPDGVEYTKKEKDIVKIKKKKVGVTVPPGEIRYFEIHYLMPAPKFTYTTTQNDASKYGGKYTESTSYDIHTYNVLSTAFLPGVPGDWDYDVDVVDATGTKQGLRHYQVDRDGDGRIDEIGWLTPQLSEVGGGVGGKPAEIPPTKVKNHNFQLVRADNPYLPEGWYSRWSYDLKLEDQGWIHMPFSNDGYDDNSSLLVRSYIENAIFSTPVNITASTTSVNINFKYKPVSDYDCQWFVGTAVMFPTEYGYDTTTDTLWYSFLRTDGNVDGFDFDATSTPEANGWYAINLTKTIGILELAPDEYRQIRFSPVLGSRTDCPGGEMLIDNVLVDVV